jgi:hypothetical protein
MKLAKGQIASFEELAVTRWEHGTAAQILDLYPARLNALGVTLDDVVAFCRCQRTYADSFEFTGNKETFKFIVIAVMLGAYFCHDPRFEQGVTYALANRAVPQDRRITLLGDFTEAWLGATWTGEGLGLAGRRLVKIVTDHGQKCISRDAIRAVLADFVVQSPSIATPQRREAFLDASLSRAEVWGLHDPHLRCAYVGAALLHGIYWFDDPLFIHLRTAFVQATSPDNLCLRLAAFYARFA